MQLPDPPITNHKSQITTLLNRPDDQRRREYKYRFAQALVFGLPVIALQIWGYLLGPADAHRWVPILQAILTGWVIYVAAAGMLFEGILLLIQSRGRKPAEALDLPVALTATAVYFFSLISTVHILFTSHPWYRPLLFHVVVLILAAWSGGQWLRWSQKPRPANGS